MLDVIGAGEPVAVEFEVCSVIEQQVNLLLRIPIGTGDDDLLNRLADYLLNVTFHLVSMAGHRYAMTTAQIEDTREMAEIATERAVNAIVHQ